MDQNQDNSVLANLLDRNLDEVADLPEFLDYCPNGYYSFNIKKASLENVETKDKETKNKVIVPTVQFQFEVVECLELADENEQEKIPKAGSIIAETVWFNKDSEKALSVIKAKFQEIGTALGEANVGQLIPKLVGLKIGAVVKSKKAKEGDNYFIQVSGCKLM